MAFRKAEKVDCEDFRKKIAKKAYERWQKRGCPHGSAWSDWFEAEKAVRAEKR